MLEECYPYYPSPEHRGSEFGSYLVPGIRNMPKVDTIIIENPSADGPYGAKGCGEGALAAVPAAQPFVGPDQAAFQRMLQKMAGEQR